jgi:hypothetical protein
MADDDSAHASGAEEFVMVEVDLAAPLDPEQEKSLRDALNRLDAQAFASCDLHPNKISLAYDPTRTHKKDLLKLIEQVGGKLKHVESEGSPLL